MLLISVGLPDRPPLTSSPAPAAAAPAPAMAPKVLHPVPDTWARAAVGVGLLLVVMLAAVLTRNRTTPAKAR